MNSANFIIECYIELYYISESRNMNKQGDRERRRILSSGVKLFRLIGQLYIFLSWILSLLLPGCEITLSCFGTQCVSCMCVCVSSFLK